MKKVIQIIIGNVLMAFTVSALILDHSIVAGGVSGISTVFHFYTGISVSLCVDTLFLMMPFFCLINIIFSKINVLAYYMFNNQ